MIRFADLVIVVIVKIFRRKEFRGKLAIAITANFTNKRTTAEAIVDEISGVAFVYKQDFFNNLYDEFGIALENVVYYKDDTHYFVMTTKKHSLLDRKVLIKDKSDPIALLSPKNVNKEKLYEYIRDACDYCTDYQLPHLDFALNHHGEPDVALFDFTSMFASNAACHIMEKKGSQLMCGLVGDGLLEPFWPTGTGIARGFLGAFDTVWAVRQFAAGDMSPTQIMAERESILKLLPQTTQENITKDFKNMSIIPSSRYPHIPKHLYSTMQVGHLYNSDKEENVDMPRFNLPSFKEVVTRSQLKQNKPGHQVINVRMKRDESQESPQRAETCDANANDFYQAMRDKRKSEMAGGQVEERRSSRGGASTLLEAYEAKAPTGSTTSGSSYQNAPGANLKEKIALRRAALEKENQEKEQEEQKTDQKTILNDINRQAEFVRKMSKTFGYGNVSNAETKPDTLTAEAEKCALIRGSSNRNSNSPREINHKKQESPKKEVTKKEKPKEEKQKKDKAKDEIRREKAKQAKAAKGGQPMSMQKMMSDNLNVSRERQVKRSDLDFGNTPSNSLHSSVAPIVPELDMAIDPELDMMLAQLENDDTFSGLGENEQKAWLESLFFQDTMHAPGRNPRDQLAKTKTQKANTLRVNQSSDTRLNPVEARSRPEGEDTEVVSTVHVNDKMKNLAQDFFKPKTTTNTPVRPTVSGDRKSSLSLERKTSLKSRRSPTPTDSLPSPSLSRKSSLTSYSTPPTSRKPSEAGDRSSIAESIGEISGANKDLTSLAQSYFQTPQGKGARKSSVTVKQEESLEEERERREDEERKREDKEKKREEEERKREDQEAKEERQKASLVASFFGGGGKTASKPVVRPSPVVVQAPKQAVRVVERASYEPEGREVAEDEDDEIERLIKAAERERAAVLERPVASQQASPGPAPPPR